jgi:antirestriction protein
MEDKQMEPTPQGGEPHPTYLPLPPTPPEQSPPQNQESPDEQVIRQGIEQALREATEINDRTARSIASQLHEGQPSALYSLASTGAIAETLSDELTRDFDQQPDQVQNWITWLESYCRNREDKGPVPDWAEPAAAIDRAEEEAQAPQDLMHHISAASTTTLGRLATVTTVGHTTEDTTDSHTDDNQQPAEPDTFSWTDAASWSPTSLNDELTRDQFEALFTETPDQELGTIEDIGWFGLLKHEDRPGGLVLSQNAYGFRYVWQTSSDERLAQQWEQLQREHDAFIEATRAYSHETTDRSNDDNDQLYLDDHTETDRDHYPEIWVSSLSDYTNGHLHGVWLDATLDPDELHHAVQFMLRNGYDHTAEEWVIMDYDDFCGLNLGEYESLEVVSRIAKGIVEHGEAFAQWIDYVGERSEEALSRFEDHYLGKFESTEAYVENLLEASDAYSFEEYVPEWLKPYVKIDVELLARDSEIELYVAEAGDGGVFVFDPQL